MGLSQSRFGFSNPFLSTSKKRKADHAVDDGFRPCKRQATLSGSSAEATDCFKLETHAESRRPDQHLVSDGTCAESDCRMAPYQGLPYAVHQLGPPTCVCEEERIQSLRSLQVLDAPPDPEIDKILKLIKRIFNTPIAFIALFDDKRIFVHSADGGFTPGDIPLRWSFCGWTLHSEEPQAMVIENALEDARFRDNLFVADPDGPGVRFYCGVPLIASNGHRLGTLCTVDVKPRRFDAYSAHIMGNLSNMVGSQLESFVSDQLDVKSQMQHQVAKSLRQRVSNLNRPMLFVDFSTASGAVLACSSAWVEHTGISNDNTCTQHVTKLFDLTALEDGSWEAACAQISQGKEYTVDHVPLSYPADVGVERRPRFKLTFAPAYHQISRDAHLFINIPTHLSFRNPGYRLYVVLVSPAGQDDDEKAINATMGQPIVPVPRTEAFEGLELDTLIGSGSYGRVYFGSWYGKNVAVKIAPYIDDSSMGNAAAWEGLLSLSLSHPNIVRTLTYALIDPSVEGDTGSVASNKLGCGSGGADGGRTTSLASSASVTNLASNRSSSGNSSETAVLSSGGSINSSATQACAGAQERQLWLIMEFCDHGTLQDAVDRGWLLQPRSCRDGRPHAPAILHTARELASALSYLHEQGIVHGDLSSFNVLLAARDGGGADAAGRTFTTKLADFGLSRALDWRVKVVTRTYGTITHVAPEVLLDGDLSRASDVYALGVIIWEMAAASRAWAGLSHSQVIRAVAHDRRLLQVPKGQEKPVADIFAVAQQCMRFDPFSRPASSQVVAMLDRLAKQK